MKKKSLTPTPHNEAKIDQIAKKVIMPGDPKRATWIAKTFLTNPKLVNNVRGMVCYTGKYKGCSVSVMAHGMGIPSICIYAHELFSFYKVKTIYRIGSCGVSKKAKCNLGDVILAKYGWSDINAPKWINVKEDKKNVFFPTLYSYNLLLKTAKEKKITIHTLPVLATNFFYNSLNSEKIRKITKCDVYEMETYGLFMEAKIAKCHAACLLTVSDNIETHEELKSSDRVTKFKNMVEIALNAIIKEKI